MLVYPSALDVSSRHLDLLTQALRRHRAALATVWRKLTVAGQVLLVLAFLPKNETYAALAAGFKVGVATAFRYIREGLDVLAQQAPSLDHALQQAVRKAYVLVDATLIRTNRVRMTTRGADAPFYSGKAHHHGMNVQVIAGPRGELLPTSPALPAARHDLACARAHHLPEALESITTTAPW